MHPITNKVRMYEVLAAGGFGNAVEQWFSVEDFVRNDPHNDRLFGIRSLRPGGRCDYDVPAADVPARCREWPGGFNISPMQPEWALVLQGELCRDPDLRLFYSTLHKPMRKALAEGGQNVRGVVAQVMLQHFLDPSSYEDLMVLLDRYLDHVVEFSAYRVGVGADRRRRCVVWECRKY